MAVGFGNLFVLHYQGLQARIFPSVLKQQNMSYNTNDVLEAHGISNEEYNQLPQAQKENLFYEALKNELPKGLAFLEQQIASFKNGKRDAGTERLMTSEDPHSETGKQVIRLLFDIPRQIIAKRHNVAIGGYNCCSPIIALTPSKLNMSLEEQFKIQSTPDC